MGQLRFFDISKKKKIIIEQPWGGLGDNLQFSTLPEMGKKLGFEVWVSNRNVYRNPDIKRLVWDLNPYIEGFTDESGNIPFNPVNGNIINHWELEFFGKTENDLPKLYYKPNKLSEYSDRIVIDSNAITSPINFNSVLENYKEQDPIILNSSYNNLKSIQTKDIFEWVDILISCKKFICQYSGSSVVTATYKINADVYECCNDNMYRFKGNNYIKLCK